MLDSFPGATMDLGGEGRESVIGANKVLGFKGSIQQSKLECEIAIKEGVSLAEIRKWTDVTVTMEADTGQTWVIGPSGPAAASPWRRRPHRPGRADPSP